jgi:phage terminase large subunit-like protein
MVDDLTRRWIRNEADQRAAENGARFSMERACYTVWWIERYCRLYEGDGYAGEPMILRGAASQSIEPVFDPFYEEDGKPGIGYKLMAARARDYMDACDGGEWCDWQYECTMRLFGWEQWSKHWNRYVRRFREAVVVVAKKNKKTPTLCGWSLYDLCGDGEPGQKVFLGARDGMQVRQNMSLHILNMIDQSPELKQECKINLNEMSVFHKRTRSLLLPLSSSNERTQKSKEGLNGSVFIDEMHVVDREFVKRLTRMGVSRPEPLRVEVTTAGNDPDGYGYERCSYAREVLEGRAENQRLFVAIYEAPPTLSDSNLAADPIKFGKMANPAWGHTIDSEEYLADYEASTRTIGDLAEFKMYRLNIWQRSSNPWLRVSDWRKCTQTFTEADLLGKPCAAGLDLGLVDDMTALSLVFPENLNEWSDGTREIERGGNSEVNATSEVAKQLLGVLEQPVKLLTWYWLPEAAVERYGSEVKYAEWAKTGRLKLVSGEALKPDEPLADLREILTRFDTKMFAYDAWHASLIIQALQNTAGFPANLCWPFQQTVKMFAFPTALMERLVLKGMLHNDGNPITEWEAGHVQVKTDQSGNMRPIKPPRRDRKKIDGIVATIMALDAATRMEARSVYETRGFLWV